jgi:uncharacterized protein
MPFRMPNQGSGPFRLHSLWRFPVKSMAGEQLDAADVTSNGLLGDRAYAFVDSQNKVGTAKRLHNLLHFQARFVESPRLGAAMPAVRITLPDGTYVSNEQAGLDEAVSKSLEHEMTLRASAPKDLSLEFAAGTLSGKYAAVTESPIAGAAPAGTFFDYAPVHLLTTSALARLHAVHPQGRFDVRRFRPNIVVETADAGFVENTWIGRTLALGNELLLGITIPCPRCVMPTLPQSDLPRDPGIIRAAAQENRLDLGDFGELPCVGVYANVLTPGRVQPGDVVRLLD